MSGHIDVNGQGPIPRHKSVKVVPTRAADVIPGSYKKALLKSSNPTEEKVRVKISKKKRSAEKLP